MPRAVLAIDQGTTGTTALVIAHDGSVLGRAYSEFTQYYPKPGWVEHDADEIWKVSLDVAGRAVASADLEGAELAAIGLTNQRETTVIWDRRTGRPVHRAVVQVRGMFSGPDSYPLLVMNKMTGFPSESKLMSFR